LLQNEPLSELNTKTAVQSKMTMFQPVAEQRLEVLRRKTHSSKYLFDVSLEAVFEFLWAAIRAL